jgi:hypothetical protein
MLKADEVAIYRGSETTEARLSRWECVVIKCFAILFLILFLSEKVVREFGSIRRTWATEIMRTVGDNESSKHAGGRSRAAPGEDLPKARRRAQPVSGDQPQEHGPKGGNEAQGEVSARVEQARRLAREQIEEPLVESHARSCSRESSAARGTAALAQRLPTPTRVWSVGPLTKVDPAMMGVVIGGRGTTITGPRVDPQTGSRATATRSAVFAGDRIVIASKVGMRNVEGAQIPEAGHQLLSLDTQTGEVKDRRDTFGFVSLSVFAACDEHIVVSGHNVVRLTPDPKDAGTFDDARGHKSWLVRNISPDGSTLGNGTDSGFELIDARTLHARKLTDLFVSDAGVSSKAALSDSPL